jgi:epsilon-lactone hydrolase
MRVAWATLNGMHDGTVRSLPSAPDAIELRHLRAFVAVAEELNFGRAAARLYLSQPALSRQIRALERLVGPDLLRRSTHRVELTLAGEALLERARDLLRGLDQAVSATRSMGGEHAERMARLWAPSDALTAGGASLQQLRTVTEELHAQFPVPADAGIAAVNAAGVPALTLTPADRPISVLFLHGGGHSMGSAFGYRHLAGALALAADTGVLVPEYRLAPEYPYPASLDDAVRAYRWLLDTGAAPIVMVGDSSGGGLVVSLLLRLRQDGLPLPGGAVLMCPWIDLTCTIQKASPDEAQPLLTLEWGRRCASAYVRDHSMDDPLLSPLSADLSGLPALLVQVGTGDALREDADRLVDRVHAYGGDARLELYPVATHDFHLFWSFLPEGADAVDRAGRFVREVAATSPTVRPSGHASRTT